VAAAQLHSGDFADERLGLERLAPSLRAGICFSLLIPAQAGIQGPCAITCNKILSPTSRGQAKVRR
jgi:hypothetical protein